MFRRKSNKKAPQPAAPEKVVIVKGPSLSTSLKLVLFGALLGSAGTFYLLSQDDDQDTEGVSDSAGRSGDLLDRSSKLAVKTAELGKVVVQSVIPLWKEAVEEAKTTASQTEQDLQQEIESTRPRE